MSLANIEVSESQRAVCLCGLWGRTCQLWQALISKGGGRPEEVAKESEAGAQIHGSADYVIVTNQSCCQTTANLFGLRRQARRRPT